MNHSSKRRCQLVLVWLLALATIGCDGRDQLNEWYGQRTGIGSGSVNGTTTLSRLFKKAGHRVRSWRHLSPSLEDADVIVWAPNDIDPPSIEAIAWLDDWLQYSYEERTLIYIGRDWEAGPTYWSNTKSKAPANQQTEFATRLLESQTEEKQRLSSQPDRLECEWFTLERGKKKTSVKQLSGRLADGIKAEKVEIEHWSSLIPNDDFGTILADGDGHPLISATVYDAGDVDWTDNDSRLILVENGSFLLNAALVNHEHRKIAGKLVAEVGGPTKRIVFLEGNSAPPIRESDPNPQPPTGLELFGVWPIGAVLAQLAALGIVFALARWPIFGVPRRLEQPSLTDFGRHVEALARLLAATRDRAYAYTQLKTYFHVGDKKNDSPSSNP